METMTKADVDKIKNGKFEVFNPSWWKERRDPAVAGQGVSRALSEVKKAFVDPEDLEKTSDTHTLLKASYSVKQLIAVLKKARTKCETVQVWTKKALLAYLSFAREYYERVSVHTTRITQTNFFEARIREFAVLREEVNHDNQMLEERIGRNGLLEAEVAKMRNQLVSARAKFMSRENPEVDFIRDPKAYNTAYFIKNSMQSHHIFFRNYYGKSLLKKYNQLRDIKHEVSDLEPYIEDKKYFNSFLKDIDALKKKLHGMRDLISRAKNTVDELCHESVAFGKIMEDEQTCATVNKLQALARQVHDLASLRQVVNAEAEVMEKYLNNELDKQIKKMRFYLRKERAEFDNKQEAGVIPDVLENMSLADKTLTTLIAKLDEYNKKFFVIRYDSLCEIRTKVSGLKKYFDDNHEQFNFCLQAIASLKKKLHAIRDSISDASKKILMLHDEILDFKEILQDEKRYVENSKYRDVLKSQMAQGRRVAC